MFLLINSDHLARSFSAHMSSTLVLASSPHRVLASKCITCQSTRTLVHWWYTSSREEAIIHESLQETKWRKLLNQLLLSVVVCRKLLKLLDLKTAVPRGTVSSNLTFSSIFTKCPSRQSIGSDIFFVCRVALSSLSAKVPEIAAFLPLTKGNPVVKLCRVALTPVECQVLGWSRRLRLSSFSRDTAPP